MRYLLIFFAICVSCVVNAQDVVTSESADSTKVDSVMVDEPLQVRPVRTLGKVAVIDTLATDSDMISIVLFNDNTWRYVISDQYKADSQVFDDHWDTSATHA